MAFICFHFSTTSLALKNPYKIMVFRGPTPNLSTGGFLLMAMVFFVFFDFFLNAV